MESEIKVSTSRSVQLQPHVALAFMTEEGNNISSRIYKFSLKNI